ncbi:beta-ketoacyl synthase chain length factor [Oleiagrimonas sp. C23AA]|uniref:beta-ketoacyl synthase chain length factor n=1 Tax=Oleiagrimonas sp. C23AA TaxID=2719047 RepID=UPI0014230B36|nr:beta-ketoacyl synthase chain length factor [Oleiagrimonas sp. C23AA]NII10883.1 beta-ketoacyl synthase chain length factor [Oleiagrimonas sp. C23AA]
MSTLAPIWIEGIGVWAQGAADWPSLRARMAETRAEPSDDECAGKPAAALLAPGERRRAPISVRLAVEAGAQAVAMSERDASTLPCLFSSAHGDSGILDYMCATLAEAPRELSPTRFHNSVHNAAAGYWTIATGCHAASDALCAWRHSFGAGLLEAIGEVLSGGQPVLLVSYDVPGEGPLGEMIDSRAPFGCALVLAPAQSERSLARLDVRTGPAQAVSSAQAPFLRWLAERNLSAGAAPLLEALADSGSHTLEMPAAPALGLHIAMEVAP